MSESKEISAFFFFIFIVLIVFILCIILFVVLFRRRQNELLLKNRLDEEKYKNELLEKELEVNKKLEKERERISLDIHDDLGASLSAIKLKAEFIQHKSDNEDVKSTLSEIVENTREISHNMREMMWSLSGENDSLDSFVIYAKNYVNQYFENSAIYPNLSISIIHDNIAMSGYLRRNLFLIIKEVCHNILKHSQATEMNFQMAFNANKLTILISDNGIGMDANQKKGNGLYSIHRRAELLGAQLEFIPVIRGTELKLTIPL